MGVVSEKIPQEFTYVLLQSGLGTDFSRQVERVMRTGQIRGIFLGFYIPSFLSNGKVQNSAKERVDLKLDVKMSFCGEDVFGCE